MRKLIAVILLACAFGANAGNIFVDFSGGSDANDGLTAGTPLQHLKEDSRATGNAAGPQHAGDVYVLKGGVSYAPAGGINNDAGSLIAINTNGNASITSGGLLTDSTVNFSTSNVLAGDYVYIFNQSTNGLWKDTCGYWPVTSVTSTTLQLSGFPKVIGHFTFTNILGGTIAVVLTNQAHAAAEMTYLVCRPITFTTNAGFGSGPAIIEGNGTNITGFNTASWNHYDGLAFQNFQTNCASGARACIWDDSGARFGETFVSGCSFSNVWCGVQASAGGNPVGAGYPNGGGAYGVMENCLTTNCISFAMIGPDWCLFQNNLTMGASGSLRNAGAFTLNRFNITIGIFSGCAGTFHGDGTGPFFTSSSGPLLANKYGCIYGNFIENAPQGIFLAQGNSMGGCFGWKVIGNILVGHFANDGTGTGSLAFWNQASPGTVFGWNVILGTNGATGWINQMNIGEADLWPSSPSTNVLVEGNITYNPSAGTYPFGQGGGKVSDIAMTNGFAARGNYYYEPFVVQDGNHDLLFAKGDINGTALAHYTFAQWQGLGFDNDGHAKFNVDPLFTSPNVIYPNLGNLILQSGSPAISDSVYSLVSAITDMQGTVRAASAGNWTIGAFQGTVTPPAAPDWGILIK